MKRVERYFWIRSLLSQRGATVFFKTIPCERLASPLGSLAEVRRLGMTSLSVRAGFFSATHGLQL